MKEMTGRVHSGIANTGDSERRKIGSSVKEMNRGIIYANVDTHILNTLFGSTNEIVILRRIQASQRSLYASVGVSRLCQSGPRPGDTGRGAQLAQRRPG